MKNRKGFTLIELLAVILILSVIMVISIPRIINFIESAQRKAFISDVESLIEIANVQYSSSKKIYDINDKEILPIYEFNNYEQTFRSKRKFGELKINGKKPQSGDINIMQDGNSYAVVVDNLISNNGKFCAATTTSENAVSKFGFKVVNTNVENYNCKAIFNGEEVDNKQYVFSSEEDEIVVEDLEPCKLDYNEEEDRYEVRSVCDLYALAYEYKNGSDISKYNNKTIYLANSLDMDDTSDLENFGEDVGKPFIPIGNSSHPFNTKFEGNMKTISNLVIDKSDSDDIGLFGYVSGGTIQGLKINNFKISGKNNSGALVGRNNGTVQGINASKIEVEGTDKVGGIVGYLNSGTVRELNIKEVTVNATGTSGGAIGYSDSSSSRPSSIAIKTGSISGTTVGELEGKGEYQSCTSWGCNTYSALPVNSLVNNVTLDGGSSKLTSSDETYSVTEDDIVDINTMDSIGIDTYIGGDNNSSGYYFDYENGVDGGDIIVKSREIYSIPSNINDVLDGSGTSENPYLITNINDWRNMTVFSSLSSKHYIITNDLNFENKKYYMFGTTYNPISDVSIEGTAKTLSNVNVSASIAKNIALIGTATNFNIKGLNLNNINITGKQNVGSLIGTFNSGSVKDIILISANVKGIEYNNNESTNYISGLVGKNDGTIDNIILKSIYVECPLYPRIISNGSITNTLIHYSTQKTYGGAGVDATSFASLQGFYYLATRSREGYNDVSQSAYVQNDIDDINFYDSFGLDTWIGGDNDASGYYYDYDLNGRIILKYVSENPMTFNLSGSGTSQNPYIINSEDDWKKASLITSRQNVYFKLTNNLNFESHKYYMLGTNQNIISGINFDGSAKYISNVLINASSQDNIGLFGNVTEANIYGLNLININVFANITGASVVGKLNGGTVKEIAVDGSNIYGFLYNNNESSNHISSIVGYNLGTVKNVLIKNAHISNRLYTRLVADGTMSNAITERATLVSTSHESDIFSIIQGYYSDLVTKNGSSVSGGFSSSYIDNLSFYSGKIETSLDGDNDNSGYYFDTVASRNGKIYVVEKHNSSSNPSGPGDGTITSVVTKINDTCDDKVAPVCTLHSFTVLDDGFNAEFSCSDDTEMNAVRSLFDYNPWGGDYDGSTFDRVGTLKSGTISNNGKTVTVSTTWTPDTTPSNPPESGTCYYFVMAGQDSCGNWIEYYTDSCYSY